MARKDKSPLDIAIWIGGTVLLILMVVLLVRIAGKSGDTKLNTLDTDANDSFCKSENVESSVAFEGAAGTTYGKLTLKNIGKKACDVDGKNYVDVRYDLRSVQNLTLVPQGSPVNEVIRLEPEQTLYSQIKYPNGAQCGGKTKQINVIYAYRINNSREAIFKTADGNPTTLNVCQNTTKTNVDIWPLSITEVTK